MKIKFTINTISFLSLILLTTVVWVGFEYYHRRNNFDIDPALVRNAGTPLPTSFDVLTLKKHYVGKDNFYEIQAGGQVSQK